MRDRCSLNGTHRLIRLRLYLKGRYEMLNEINCEEVYADLVEWLDVDVGEEALNWGDEL
jgi:hypothetical protein